jgi:glycosyltransferase involved in cell wall biosynthesis
LEERAKGEEAALASTLNSQLSTTVSVSLLTGGGDKPYALGLASALTAQGVSLDFIGSDDLDVPELRNDPRVCFLNLRGDQTEQASLGRKTFRIVKYYGRLIWYAATGRPRIFHILWNNKFELFDRTVLLLFYKALGKKLVFTAHNVNAGKRDGNDSWVNRLTLRIQYKLVDHILVHTQKMKEQLQAGFGVPESRVTIIPFGINNTIPVTRLSAGEAKQRLGIQPHDKIALFFGQIAPYKGLEYLVAAMAELGKTSREVRLIIAGKVKKGFENYWGKIQAMIQSAGVRERIIERIAHIPDSDVELYFKAADVLVLPYIHIFQSGLPFLAYNFGLPVIAADVGSLREDIIEGRTGFVCQPRDPAHLASRMETYFSSELYQQLETRRQEIRDFSNERHSWVKAGEITNRVYHNLVTQCSSLKPCT